MQESIFAVVIFIFLGVVFILLGLPLKHGKVPPNWFYGFRTRKTLSSEEIWYAVNRVTGIDMIRTGVTLSAAGVVMLVLRDRIAPEAAIVILLIIAVGMTVWMAIHGFSVLRRF
jgi:uncharacterized membrane protein